MTIFTAISGNYSQIASLLTPTDGAQFLLIFNEIKTHAESQKKFDGLVASQDFYTLQDYAINRISVNLSDKGFLIPSIASLIATGVIFSSDNVHIGVSLLGLGFYQYIMENQ